jgi:hypothetical protein
MLIEVTPRDISGEQAHCRQTECSEIISYQLRLLEDEIR